MQAVPYCATGTATVTQTGTAGGTYTAPAGVIINAATGDINLRQAHLELTQLLTSLQLVHVAIQQLLQYTITALPTATISYAVVTLLCNRNCNCYSNRNRGRNIYCTCRSFINAATGDINFATSTPGTYTITYSFTVGACSNTATTSITITALPLQPLLIVDHHIAQPEQQLLLKPELRVEHIRHLQEL